jgi:hypothetical protein
MVIKTDYLNHCSVPVDSGYNETVKNAITGEIFVASCLKDVEGMEASRRTDLAEVSGTVV